MHQKTGKKIESQNCYLNDLRSCDPELNKTWETARI